MVRCSTTAALLFLSLCAGAARADLVNYTDRGEWELAAGLFTTITFTEYPQYTRITTQYAPLGVEFTGGEDHIFHTPSFLNDGSGLDGNSTIDLSFDAPIYSIAVEFPGAAQMELFRDGRSLGVSAEFGGSGTGWFGGVVSAEPFDEVVMWDWDGLEVEIDDLHFGPPVPAPGALALLGLASALHRRHRGR